MAEEPEAGLPLPPSCVDSEGPTMDVSPGTATLEPSSTLVSLRTEEPAGDTKKKKKMISC